MDVVSIATQFGVTAACLFGLSIAVWRGIIWVSTNIAKPVADRHIKFLDDLSLSMSAQSQALQTLMLHQGKTLETQEELVVRLDRIDQKQEEILRLLRGPRAT